MLSASVPKYKSKEEKEEEEEDKSLTDILKGK